MGWVAITLGVLGVYELWCYYSARRRTEAYLQTVLDGQSPPGCTCIRNALMPNSRCPHHGDLDG